MTRKELPPPELLHKLLQYEPDTGKFFWLPRDVSFFSDGVRSASRQRDAWNGRFAGREAFTCLTDDGYKGATILRISCLAHRVAWVMSYGALPKNHIDHINGIRDDNRIANLRDVRRTINQRNMKMKSNNTSGYNGVFRDLRRDKWGASICINNQKKHLGYFDDISDAVIARRNAETGNGFTERHGRKPQ